MQRWNNIINTALLGTAKKAANSQGLSGPLQQAADKILAANTLDREDQLLQLAAVMYNYRQSGAQPETATVTPIAVCAAETKAYCTPQAIQVLHQVLETDSQQLLQQWLEYCIAANLLIPLVLLPGMLEKAYRNKSLRTMIAAVSGQRGEWLGQLNTDWNFSIVAESIEEPWQNGTTAQRFEALQELRSTDPVMALNWLQETWPKENAAVKKELIAALSINISITDADWLETLLSEKSKQVKEAAIYLLKKITGSTLHENYRQVLVSAIQLHNNTVTCVFPEKIADEIFASGIEKLSSSKAITDEAYILDQLIRSVHPAVWEKHFNRSPKEVLALFAQQPVLNPFIPALVNAILWFHDSQWALACTHYSEIFHIDLIPLLPPAEQDVYSEKYFDEYPDVILQQLLLRKEEWSITLADKVLRFCANNPFTNNQAFMNNCIRFIPVAIAKELDQYTTENANYFDYWKSIKAHLLNLLQVKKLTSDLYDFYDSPDERRLY
ncbi:hypothetical protein CLV51_104221 [Chitinophaga niastensis]|uniref:Uncharacterized protein n=1 Tax=Chitinophaga niastensis TaxID=536980 RepID=A0A2P8HH33_CHINA|nr:DUF5691 domain-containing protein [Chitinophaga niastensis]PSL45516.1 hypothetical protein CLV51_104221 [Chitinophaga niastensis]